MDKHIKNYKVLREIGKGGMGIVYKALDPATQKHVAIKVLPPSMVDRTTVERFTREARSMARMKHHNLVEVSDVGMSEGEHYFVMEYIEGENLKTIIKKEGKMSVENILRVISKVGEALVYAHEEGIIHRDVKPANIMVTTDGRVKLMDFGLVHIAGVTKITVEGGSVGTAEYMSPEQIFDEDVDLRTDIYSLGVTMYEALTGKPPFSADSVQAVLMKHKYEQATPIRMLCPEVPEDVEKIVMKALSKDVSQRYQKVQEMIDDINHFRGVSPQKEKEVPAADRPASSDAMIKIKKRLPLVLGVVIILGAGFWFRNEIKDWGWGVLQKAKFPIKNEKMIVQENAQNMKALRSAEKYYGQGVKLFRDGELDAAIAAYQNAIKLRKDYGLYYKDLAIAFEKKKDYRQATKAWNELLRFDHSGSFAEMAIQHLEMLKNQMK